MSRTVTYTLPALALIWYMIYEKKTLFPKNPFKPTFSDLYSFAIGFPALVLIGLGLSFAMSLFSSPLPPKIEAPETAAGWVVMGFSCAGTGYLEESFFRFYLLRKMKTWTSATWVRVVFSVFLFAVCHIYEGPWGILNAVLAGLLLAILFERFKSLHGIALAHGSYNAFVYVLGIFV